MSFRLNLVAIPMLVLSSGCGYVHIGKMPVATSTEVVVDNKILEENSDLKLQKKLLEQELNITRAQGSALRSAIENRTADGDTSKKLVEKLNETSKQLAELKQAYAALKDKGSNELVADLREKLANSHRDYTVLQNEVMRLQKEVQAERAQNIVLSEKVKVITSQNEEAQMAIAQLNVSLMEQKKSKEATEQMNEMLRKEITNKGSLLADSRIGSANQANSMSVDPAEANALKEEVSLLKGKVQQLTLERDLILDKNGESIKDAPAIEESQLSKPLREQLQILQSRMTELTEENIQLKVRLSKPKPIVNVETDQAAYAIVKLDKAELPSHVIAPGETLATISSKYYGSPDKWIAILNANKDILGDNNDLIIGRKLRIPKSE